MSKSPSRLPTSRRASRKALSPQPSASTTKRQPSAPANEIAEYTFDPEDDGAGLIMATQAIDEETSARRELSSNYNRHNPVADDQSNRQPDLNIEQVLTLIAVGVSKIFIHIGEHAALYEQGDLRNSLECFGYASAQSVDHMLRQGWLRQDGILLRITEAGQRVAARHQAANHA